MSKDDILDEIINYDGTMLYQKQCYCGEKIRFRGPSLLLYGHIDIKCRRCGDIHRFNGVIPYEDYYER